MTNPDNVEQLGPCRQCGEAATMTAIARLVGGRQFYVKLCGDYYHELWILTQAPTGVKEP